VKLLDPESKNRNNTKVHNVVFISKTIYSQKKPEKSGLLKRFLTWLARGVDESHKGKPFCPT
jgi:hypothetical protein